MKSGEENSDGVYIEAEINEESNNKKADSAIWECRETINGAKIMEDIQIYKLNKEIKIDYKGYEGVLIIETVRVSPVSVKVKYRYKSDINMNDDEYLSRPSINIFNEKGDMILGAGVGTEDKVKYIDNGEVRVELSR